MRFLILLLACSVWAQTFPDTLRGIRIASLGTNLTQITNASDGSGRLFVVEQRGIVRIIRDGAVADRPFLDITGRVLSGGERGLLSIVFPPGFRDPGHFYVNYTDRPNGATVIARFRVSSNPDVADPATEQILLTIPQPYANHNGGMMAFSPRDGLLYVGMGDGGSAGDPQNYAQNPQSFLGKMLRLNPEGVPGPIQGDFFQQWARGLRNPWRFSFDRETGDLWIADVGQNRLEEINFQPAASGGGENYGWRRMEGSQCYESGCDRTGLTLPVFEYGREFGCSVTGGYVYRGQRYPALRGTYLLADYCSGNTWALRGPSESFASRLITRLGAEITSFGEDEQGELYFVDGNGGVFLLASGPPMFLANAAVNAASYRPGLTPGSLASLFGSGITAVNGVLNASAFPLPRTLAGTSVSIDGIEAPVLAVANVNGQEQINIQVPWELTGRTSATIVITNNGVASPPATVALDAAQPGLFAATGAGRQWTLWATGLGAVETAPATGAPSSATPVRESVRVLVSGVDAEITYSGLAPTYAGLYQVNIRVPATVQAGEVEVVLSAAGATSNALKVRLD